MQAILAYTAYQPTRVRKWAAGYEREYGVPYTSIGPFIIEAVPAFLQAINRRATVLKMPRWHKQRANYWEKIVKAADALISRWNFQFEKAGSR